MKLAGHLLLVKLPLFLCLLRLLFSRPLWCRRKEGVSDYSVFTASFNFVGLGIRSDLPDFQNYQPVAD